MKLAGSKPETVPRQSRQKIRFTTLQDFYDNTCFFQVDSCLNTLPPNTTVVCQLVDVK